jgi:predicted PurR-regulated permease PerM
VSVPAITDPRLPLPGRRVVGLLVLAAVVFWFARPVIAPFIVAALVAYAFSPYIDAVQARTGRSRFLIVVVGYGTGLVVVGLVVLAFAGPLYRELGLLTQAGPDALATALRQLLGSDSITIGDRTITVEEIATQLQAAVTTFLQTPEGAIKAAEQVLHGALDAVLTIIVTFYLLLDGARFSDTALRFVDPADRAQLERVAARIHVVVGRWLRGQLVLVVLVAVVVTIFLGPVLKLPYAAALGVLTGLLEVITLIGPLIAGTIVAIVALSSGGLPTAIAAVVFLFVLRQIEDIVIMPNVLGRAVHLHPLAALFAVVVGSTAFGIIGTFLAVPVAAAINVALHEFFPAELGPLPGDPVSVGSAAAPAARVAPAAEAPEPPASTTGPGTAVGRGSPEIRQ